MSPHVMYGSAVLFLGLPRGIGCVSIVEVHCNTQHLSSGSLVFTHLGKISKDATIVYNVFSYLLLLYNSIITIPCIDT